MYNYIQFVYYETCLSFVVNQNFILEKKNADVRGGGGGGKALRTRGSSLKWPKNGGRPLWTAPLILSSKLHLDLSSTARESNK